MSTPILWLLLILVISGFLFFDLNVAWNHYRNTQHDADAGWPFVRWWAQENRGKLAMLCGVILVTSSAILLQEHTLRLPDIRSRVVLARQALWGVALLLLVGAFLSFDLSVAWKHYRNTQDHAVAGRPFILWWVKENRAKLAILCGVILLMSLPLFLPEQTLLLPDIRSLLALTRRAKWAGGAIFLVGAFVLFDLLSWRYYHSGRGEAATGVQFYQWWIRKSSMKFCAAAGVACLVLGGAWGVNRYNNQLQLKSESSGYITSAHRYYREKKFQEATLELRNAIKQNPGDYEAYLWLARSYWQLGSLTEARDAYREALRVEAKLPSAHLELGRLALIMKEPAVALTEAGEAARLAPENVEPRLLLAQIQSGTGNRSEALEQCRTILEGEFSSPELRQQLIVLLLRQHAPAEALHAADAGLAKIPHDQPLRYLQAQALEDLNRFDEAENVLRSIAADTAAPEPCLALGDLMIQRGKHQEALKEYETALKRAPNHDRAMNNFASVNAEYGFDIERSATLAARLYNRQPRNPTVADTLGWTLFRQGKIELALPLLRQGVAGIPDNPVHRYHLGAALIKSGQGAAGNRELSTALQISEAFDGAAKARELIQLNRS